MKKGKKILFWVIGIFVVLLVIGALSDDEESKETTAKKDAQVEEKKDSKDESNEKAKQEEQKKKDEEKAKQEEDKKLTSISKTDLTNEGMTKAVKKKDKDVDKVIVEGNKVTITYKKDLAFWDETSLFRDTAKNSAELFEQIFKRDDVAESIVIVPTTFTDQLGNESTETAISITLKKEMSAKINYKNFTDSLVLHPAYMYNASNEYYIHPGIYKAVDKKYIKELQAGFSKVE